MEVEIVPHQLLDCNIIQGLSIYQCALLRECVLLAEFSETVCILSFAAKLNRNFRAQIVSSKFFFLFTTLWTHGKSLSPWYTWTLHSYWQSKRCKEAVAEEQACKKSHTYLLIQPDRKTCRCGPDPQCGTGCKDLSTS